MGRNFRSSHRVVIAALVLLAAAACTTASWYADGTDWFKDGATKEEFQRDKAACESSSPDDVAGCLNGLGYSRWGSPRAMDRARDTPSLALAVIARWVVHPDSAERLWVTTPTKISER